MTNLFEERESDENQRTNDLLQMPTGLLQEQGPGLVKEFIWANPTL